VLSTLLWAERLSAEEDALGSPLLSHRRRKSMRIVGLGFEARTGAGATAGLLAIVRVGDITSSGLVGLAVFRKSNRELGIDLRPVNQSSVNVTIKLTSLTFGGQWPGESCSGARDR
jgi:hypothetical protein